MQSVNQHNNKKKKPKRANTYWKTEWWCRQRRPWKLLILFHVNELNNNFSENEFNGTNILCMNISSICCNFDDLQTLLAKINVKLNVIVIRETRLNKTSIRNTNIDLSSYSFEHTTTEANCGAALLYIDNNINYVVQDDLCIYKTKELESVFIEIINSKGKNTIVRCVYWHPCMNPTQFIEIYVSKLLQKFSKKDKTIMLMGAPISIIVLSFFEISILIYWNMITT